MIRPLYNDSKNIIPDKLGDGNTGLWYDKFCNQWCRDEKKRGLDAWTLSTFKQGNVDINPKMDWINTVSVEIGDKKLIEIHIERREKFFNQINVSALYFKLTSDFVTGLGREHPVENGFAWHHTLGSPYLPGSSVKGMLRAWASQWNDAETKDKVEIDRIFGFQNKVGTVIFMDALPISKVSLKADIMTPHYSPYYQSSLEEISNKPPADWYSPTPIPFLVVSKKEATFQFGITPRNPECELCKKDCQTATKWLTNALEWIGAGAKTAVGYGRFEPDLESEYQLKVKMEKEKQKKEEEKKTQQALQGKSSIAQKLITKATEFDWEVNKSKFVLDSSIWLPILEKNPQKDALEFIKNLIDFHIPGILEKPDATEGKKKKQKYKDFQIKVAKQFNEIRKNCK